jgi:hypothetical protein
MVAGSWQLAIGKKDANPIERHNGNSEFASYQKLTVSSTWNLKL